MAPVPPGLSLERRQLGLDRGALVVRQFLFQLGSQMAQALPPPLPAIDDRHDASLRSRPAVSGPATCMVLFAVRHSPVAAGVHSGGW